MRDPERWWQTFKWAMLWAVLTGAAWGLLIGCATAPKPGPCVVTACGYECCNNDWKRCPPCWEDDLDEDSEGPPLESSEVKFARLGGQDEVE